MADAADARLLPSWMVTHAFEGVPDGAKDLRVDLLSVPADQLAGFVWGLPTPASKPLRRGWATDRTGSGRGRKRCTSGPVQVVIRPPAS
jgi:hypothetical protein